MIAALVISAFGVVAAAISVWTVVRLVPTRQAAEPAVEALTDAEVSEAQQLREELEALREMVLQVRWELSDARREAASVRQGASQRPNRRSIDLEKRKRRAIEAGPNVVELPKRAATS